MTGSADLRIVSLIPSGTEIVAALGLADHLVGRSHECDSFVLQYPGHIFRGVYTYFIYSSDYKTFFYTGLAPLSFSYLCNFGTSCDFQFPLFPACQIPE